MHTVWSVKGGVGATVVAAALAGSMRRRGPVVLVDLCGDAPAALGLAEPDGPGLLEWLGAPRSGSESLHRLRVPVAPGWDLLPCGHDRDARWAPERAELLAATLAGWPEQVVVDAGRVGDITRPAAQDHLVRTLGGAGRSVLVTRACYLALRRAVRCELVPDAVVLVAEAGRSLGRPDVADVLGIEQVAELDHDMSLARAVDAGLLTRRRLRSAERALAPLW